MIGLNTSLITRNLGLFYIDKFFIQESRPIFSKVVPLHVECRLERDRLEVYAWSPELFDLVPDHETIPTYDIHLADTGEVIARKLESLPFFPELTEAQLRCLEENDMPYEP